jgi:hypothetical protein
MSKTPHPTSGIQVCPLCGSPDFSPDKSNKFLEAVGSSTAYECQRCHNIFQFPLETDEPETPATLNESIRHATPANARAPYGVFFWRFWGKVLAVFLMMGGGLLLLAENNAWQSGGILVIFWGICLFTLAMLLAKPKGDLK